MDTPNPQDSIIAEVCYRHPDRSTGVSCQRCDRLICSKCMHQASVGVHCPECTKGSAQRVYTANTLPGSELYVTKALIGINVVVFLIAMAFYGASLWSGGSFASDFATYAPLIDEGNEYWRIITSGFGHFGLIHLGMNMYALWWLGGLLERSLGPKVFFIAYMATLIGGSMGALLVEPRALSMGASGAVFGLLGLAVLALRSRGIGLQQSGLGRILLLNLFISLSGFVSLGGHAGGFIAGLLLGVMYYGVNQGDGPMLGGDTKKHIAVTVLFGMVLFAGSIWVSTFWENPIF